MRYKTIVTLSVVLGTVIMLSGFMPREEKRASNLKVLPKNISNEELDKVMDGFKAALGVKCNFCHAASADDPKHLDFASDAKPEKEIARSMMKMTYRINKKDFHIKDVYNPKAVLAVNCITCHRGQAHPDEK
ncbi:c-type cytochrome [Pedobacter cryoconitis]|uniref:Photosynthetic reaction center cytochrome c subunit n=1 Tax=Pedobacter cryoconitis TaxID=188932 RepID=A0A327SDQ1_9SPHI|nr:c-type cytochrome [Pedobacter cryoconitis]RAJ26054.1 photosynthetic reaction center cytochrome c subunit [Pedobacter cryoconitis]